MDLKNKRVVYHVPGMENVTVRRGVEYAGPLTLDLYYPPGYQPDEANLRPAVVIVLGYPDAGVPTFFGCQFREMGMMVSWCQLLAASGIVGVVYETSKPTEDVNSVFSFLQKNGGALGIDKTRIGVWSASGNAPVALSVLMSGKALCGVLFYGITLDLDGATDVARSAAAYHFANPTTGRRVEDLLKDTALFLARAGRDQFAGLNEALDRFLVAAVRCNLPVTFANHPTGPHGFDYEDDSDESRQVIRCALAFLQAKMRAPTA